MEDRPCPGRRINADVAEVDGVQGGVAQALQDRECGFGVKTVVGIPEELQSVGEDGEIERVRRNVERGEPELGEGWK